MQFAESPMHRNYLFIASLMRTDWPWLVFLTFAIETLCRGPTAWLAAPLRRGMILAEPRVTFDLRRTLTVPLIEVLTFVEVASLGIIMQLVSPNHDITSRFPDLSCTGRPGSASVPPFSMRFPACTFAFF